MNEVVNAIGTAGPAEIISAEGLTMVYSSKNKVRALNDVSLIVKKGEFVSVRGPSGSGKSTFLNILGCLDVPTKGTLSIDGVDTSKLNDNELARIRREKIGFIFQSFNLLPILNAVENVELPMENMDIKREQRRERAMKLLHMVGLKDRWDHRPKELSGGENQRVAIARALANSPSILLADEPTGNLDSKTGKGIMNLLKDLNKNLGTTVIVVTHDISVAKRADRQLFMEDGRVQDRTHEVSVSEGLNKALNLSKDICKKLSRAGYHDVGAILKLDEGQLKMVKGLRKKEIDNILSKVKRYNMGSEGPAVT
jgi:putative ABC transport system ATP-binding protein